MVEARQFDTGNGYCSECGKHLNPEHNFDFVRNMEGTGYVCLRCTFNHNYTEEFF